MNIVEALREAAEEDQELRESWGDPVDVTEFMTDSVGFFNTNGLGAFTQIYDRSDGRFRPVYTNESDLKVIRAMSWLLVEKVPMAQAWINRLLDYTVGTGFDWTIKHESPTIQAACKAFVREFFDDSKWSSELERESYVREVSEGEFLGDIIWDNGQSIMVSREADELTEPAAKGELEDWLEIDYDASWSFGVLTKKLMPERPLGYHFVRDSAGLDWDFRDAGCVVHWKRNVRARAKRGFSDFYKPHLYLLRADRVLTNTAEGAATQAAIAYIVEHANASTQARAENIVAKFAAPTGRVDPMTGLSERRRRMRPGTRLDVPSGQQYKAGLLGSNNSQIYIDVLESALRLAGSVHAFPEGMLTGSYQNANFASSLTAEGPFVQGRVAEQIQRAERMREMILKVIKHAAKRGRFKRVGVQDFESLRDGLVVEIIPAKVIPRDPDKLAQSLAVQKQNGWVSDKTAITELGRDIDVEIANGLKVGQDPSKPPTGQDAQGKPAENAPEPKEESKWLGLSRLQWQRNRKAVADVLNDYAKGKMRQSVAKVLLRSIGMPEPDIQTMLRDASDGTVDSLPPEEQVAESFREAEKKTLNRPFRTPSGPKKFAVYVKNEKGNVIRLPFGDPKASIKRDDPGKRKGFRARHNCKTPGPKWKARYWSCRFWSKPSVTKLLKESMRDELPWDGRSFVRESWLLKVNPTLFEAFCPTGKGGKVNPRCAPKNKGRRKQSGNVATSPVVPEPSYSWNDAGIEFNETRMEYLRKEAHLLDFDSYMKAFEGIQRRRYSDAGRAEEVGQFEQMLADSKAGKVYPEFRSIGYQMAQAKAEMEDRDPTDEEVTKAALGEQRVHARGQIEQWEAGKRLMEKNPDGLPNSMSLLAMSNHKLAVYAAIKEYAPMPLSNKERYLQEVDFPKEFRSTTVLGINATKHQANLDAFAPTAERLKEQVGRAVASSEQKRQSFLAKAKELTVEKEAERKRVFEEFESAKANVDAAVKGLHDWKQTAKAQLEQEGKTYESLYSLPEDHPLMKQKRLRTDAIIRAGEKSTEINERLRELNSYGDVHALLKPAVSGELAVSVSPTGQVPSSHVDFDKHAMRSTNFFKSVASPSIVQELKASVYPSEDRIRAFEKDGVVHIDYKTGTDVWVHELGHTLETQTGTSDYAKTFLFNRAKDFQASVGQEKPSVMHLGGNHDLSEFRVPDELSYMRRSTELGESDLKKTDYAEKWYAFDASEVLSIGVERLYREPIKFAEESPDHFNYTLAVLHGEMK